MTKKQYLINAIALSLLLNAPISAYAANNGTEYNDVPEVGKKVYSHKYMDNGDVSGADLQIDTSITGTYDYYIVGGFTKQGTASGNKVTINADIIGAPTVGGYSMDGNATGNKVLMQSGSTGSLISGGMSYKGDASYNEVTISGGSLSNNTMIAGGASNIGEASHNIVNITSDITSENVYIIGGSNGTGNVIDNTINISGTGTLKRGTITGSHIETRGDAKNNTINISGNITFDKGTIFGGSTDGGNISDNKVTISSGNFTNGSIIYGGFTQDGNVINNSITIEGTAILADDTEIGGGMSGGLNADFRTGNTLNIYRSGVSIKKADNFQNYDLAIDPNNTTLTVKENLTLLAGDQIYSSRVLADMNVGDTATLLASAGTLDISNATLVNGKAQQGILYLYGYELVEENGKLVVKITSKEGNKQTSSVADGRLAALGMLTSGADLVADSAMSNAANQGSNQYDMFGAMSYGQHSMNSVSSIDVQATSMLVGMSRNLRHTNSNTTIGAFLESGWGTYDSEMSGAKAKGHTNYYGLGLLARSSQDSGLYTEGSLRIGRIGNTYSGRTADDGTYDASSTYYGAHLGIGKITKINDNSNWDMYAKYFWTHQTATDAKIMGDQFDFSATDSHRARIGARYNNTNKNVTRYIGLAYEHEFSGSANATALGIDVASPSVKGSSGILELGAVYKPSQDSRFSMDFGMNAYAGKRQGFSGNMKLNWSF